MMLTPTDISKILNVTPSHVSLLAKNFSTSEEDYTKVGKRVFFDPSVSKKIFETRGVDFKVRETICFGNNKGGVGKTSTSVNVALRLSAMGYKVLLIDADSQASATSYILGDNYGDTDQHTLIDIVTEKATLEESVKTITSTLDLLPSALKNSLLDTEFQQKAGLHNPSTYFKDMFKKHDYNFVIWDLSPTITTSLYWYMLSCNKIITVTNLEEFAVQGAEMTVNLVQRLKANNPGFTPQLGVLINRFDERNKSLYKYLSRLQKLEEQEANIFSSVIKTDANIPKTQGSQGILPSTTQAFKDMTSFVVELCELDKQISQIRN